MRISLSPLRTIMMVPALIETPPSPMVRKDSVADSVPAEAEHLFR